MWGNSWSLELHTSSPCADSWRACSCPVPDNGILILELVQNLPVLLSQHRVVLHKSVYIVAELIPLHEEISGWLLVLMKLFSSSSVGPVLPLAKLDHHFPFLVLKRGSYSHRIFISRSWLQSVGSFLNREKWRRSRWRRLHSHGSWVRAAQSHRSSLRIRLYGL